MKEKIKVLVTDKKPKITEVEMTLEGIIESDIPGVYEFIYTDDEKGILKSVEIYQPEIIHLSVPLAKIDCLRLVKKIKQVHPAVAIFVFFLMEFDDEQEEIDKYMSQGVYKCYLEPLHTDALIHDMYVALNLESL